MDVVPPLRQPNLAGAEAFPGGQKVGVPGQKVGRPASGLIPKLSIPDSGCMATLDLRLLFSKGMNVPLCWGGFSLPRSCVGCSTD